MKHYFLLFLFFINISNQLFPQSDDPYVDSLMALLHRSEAVEMVDLLNKLAIETVVFTPEKTKQYANEARLLAQKLNYESGEALAILRIGGWYMYMGIIDTALYYVQQALLMHRETQSMRDICCDLLNLGVIYLQTNKLTNAGKYLHEALSFSKENREKIAELRVVYQTEKKEKADVQEFVSFDVVDEVLTGGLK